MVAGGPVLGHNRAVSVEEPYGELLQSTVRVLSWNVWGRFGPWEEREGRLVAVLAQAAPDVVVLQESWVTDGGVSQAERLASALGYGHWFAGTGSLAFDGWSPVAAIVSRWPITDPTQTPLVGPEPLRGWPGEVLAAVIDGPRGPIPLMNVALDWPPQSSALRQASVRRLAELAKEWGAHRRFPVVVGGDFNAPPDSAELRMLTGYDATAIPGFVLFDAWDKAGEGRGVTWDRGNRWAAPTLLPSRRIDYILTGWPSQEGGAGDVVAAEIVGFTPGDDQPPSDHYGVLATLRY
jgi:endonuclease/exonuclease/phosphatase family metal-dependent hydrolase